MLVLIGRCLKLFALSVAVTLISLVWVAAEVVVLLLVAPGLCANFGPALGFLLFVLLLGLSLALAIAAHEGGHVLGGRLAGLSPHLVRVGPVTFSWSGGRWRSGWDGGRNWLSGWVACELRRPSRLRLAVFLAAGPLVNFCLGVVSAGSALLVTSSLAQAGAAQFALVSAFLGLMSLVPLQERRRDSDGLALLRLFAGRPVPFISRNLR